MTLLRREPSGFGTLCSRSGRMGRLPDKHHDPTDESYDHDGRHDEDQHPDTALPASVRQSPWLCDAVVLAPVRGILAVSVWPGSVAHPQRLADEFLVWRYGARPGVGTRPSTAPRDTSVALLDAAT